MLIVWPRQSEPAVRAHETTWEEAAREAWAMDAEKAKRVAILVAVFDDVIVGAWSASALEPDIRIPEGKTRNVSRSAFITRQDNRLDYLVGTASPWKRRRNPQTTVEVRDLPGAESFLSGTQSEHGIVRVGAYVLSVSPSGTAELQMPAGRVVTIRTIEN